MYSTVGKSTLLTKLTGTFSLAAGYEFTTLTAIPGTMNYRCCSMSILFSTLKTRNLCSNYRGAKIQVLDLPGIIEGAKDGKGRGRQVIASACTCNVILIVLDALKSLTHKNIIEKELHGFGIRINQNPPDIIFKYVFRIRLISSDTIFTYQVSLYLQAKRSRSDQFSSDGASKHSDPLLGAFHLP